MKRKQFKGGYFNHKDFTVRFGGEMSTSENRFIATAIKVPDYTIQYLERIDEGGGWYSSEKELVTKVMNHVYLIIRDNNIIGYMIDPYTSHEGESRIKTNLIPVDNNAPKEVIEFADKSGLDVNNFVCKSYQILR